VLDPALSSEMTPTPPTTPGQHRHRHRGLAGPARPDPRLCRRLPRHRRHLRQRGSDRMDQRSAAVGHPRRAAGNLARRSESSGSWPATQCPEKPVALCDWPRRWLATAPSWWPPAGPVVPLTPDAGRGPAQERSAEESGMLAEPCRSVFMQLGRRIVI